MHYIEDHLYICFPFFLTSASDSSADNQGVVLPFKKFLNQPTGTNFFMRYQNTRKIGLINENDKMIYKESTVIQKYK